MICTENLPFYSIITEDLQIQMLTILFVLFNIYTKYPTFVTL